MKFTLILLFAVAAVANAKFEVRNKEDALKAHEECLEDNTVPDEIYEKFLNYEFPEHKRTNCYIKCFVEKMGLFTELKGFDENAIITQFTYKNFKNLESVRHGLEKCIDHNEWESDTCTWANRVFSCWLKINRHVVRKIYGDA
ncbi:general odorant-binding protein 99a-like isoform X2 [Teleopsis dalmanni]|uniref:general odorant-binding protein 99a-like isoform X2 n=1 Tax=Teleopsis dalmanni TaxID=139649 RepID=UPI0018CE9204|nr:general odorant-binding protein 99a-like isoform X2 [Teleopsis dalmanni]